MHPCASVFHSESRGDARSDPILNVQRISADGDI